MIEFLNDSVLWWHWIIFGIILLILDMTLATFFILALGVAGITAGVIDLLFASSLTQELLAWMILSILIITGWFKWFRQKPLTQSGQSSYRLDTLGTITQAIEPHSRGKVTFDTPVLGDTTWHATSKIALEANTRVQIVQINGQLIEVEPLHTTA